MRSPRETAPQPGTAPGDPAGTPRVPYTSSEEVSLPEAWLEVSEDPNMATNRNRARFWGTVTTIFKGCMQPLAQRGTSSGSPACA